MSAGTITLANNSNAVAGDGTAFTTELAAGDFIVVTTGGVTYTLPVKSIESDTALTLARNYNGPAVTAGAWTAMPRDTLNRISAQIAADTAYAIRQRVLEIDNWYQLLEVNGDVTIKMADGSSYTGPSWLKLIDVMKEMQIDQIIPIAEQIRADAQQVADDKTVIVQAKDDAEAAAIAAAASEENAATSESNSASSASTASTKADEAAESARQAAESNPMLALQKSLNLSDLEDRDESWMNVRPTGATPLAADAVGDEDAPRWKQVKDFIASVRNVLSSWSVINSLTVAPGVSTTTYGGDVNSTLKVGTADYGKAGLRAVVNSDASGVKTVGAQVVVTDSTGSTSTQKVINLGTVNGLTGGSISGTYLGLAGSSTGGFVGLEINNTASDPAGCYYNAVMNGYVRGGIEITNDRDGKSGYALRLLFSRNNSVTTDHRELGLSINSNGTTWMVSQPTYGSDERLKKEVEDIGSTRDALRTLRTSRYVMDGRRQIGLIAQDVQKYWPELIDNFEKVTYSESGEKTEGTYLSLNYTGMIAPTIKAVNENSDTIDKLMDIVKEAIATIAGVTTDESAKAVLEALAERIPAPDTQ